MAKQKKSEVLVAQIPKAPRFKMTLREQELIARILLMTASFNGTDDECAVSDVEQAILHAIGLPHGREMGGYDEPGNPLDHPDNYCPDWAGQEMFDLSESGSLTLGRIHVLIEDISVQSVHRTPEEVGNWEK